MPIKIITYVLIIILKATILYADVAILPYKLNGNLNDEMSIEYAKLSAIVLYEKKKIKFYSFDLLIRYLNEYRINIESNINKDKLKFLGKILNVDYIQTGMISKKDGKYFVQTLLYNVNEEKIISKCREYSQNIYDLAEKEIDLLYVSFKNYDSAFNNNIIDLVITIDNSFSISNEINYIKDSLVNLQSYFSQIGYDVKCCIVGLLNKDACHNLKYYYNISSQIEKIMPVKDNEYIFYNNFECLAKQIFFRNNSKRILINVLSQRNFYRIARLRHYFKKNGVDIISIIAGNVDNHQISKIKYFSDEVYFVTYKQRIYDLSGNPIDIFYEAGNIFYGDLGDNWVYGIAGQNDAVLKIITNEKVYLYNMLKLYKKYVSNNVLNYKKLENNIPYIFKQIKFNKKTTPIIGKALILNNGIALWLPIKDKKTLRYLKEFKDYYVYIGLYPIKDGNSLYGIKLLPYCVVGLNKTDIPEFLIKDFNEIITNKNLRGLFAPSLWFVKVKIKKILLYSADIRKKVD